MSAARKAEQRKDRRIVVENVRRMLLKEYLMRETQRAGFGGLDIQRTPMGTRVTLIAERPGLVIGRKGGAIKALTEAVERQFSFDNPQIEVQEVTNPSLNAQIMAEKLANALERGWHFRRAGHSTVRRIMENGARGCQVIISGKLTGQRHRTEKFKDGHIKYCGQAKLNFMHQGFAAAKLKPGIIGVTVQIMDPNAKLPDEITIIPPAPATEAPVATPEVAAAAAKADDKKAEEAVAELKKTLEGDSPAKLKRVRKKKEGEPQAPMVPGEGEKKIVRKPRKKKEVAQPAAGEAIVAVTPPVQAIVVTEQPKPPAESPEKKEEKKAEQAEEKKEAQ